MKIKPSPRVTPPTKKTPIKPRRGSRLPQKKHQSNLAASRASYKSLKFLSPVRGLCGRAQLWEGLPVGGPPVGGPTRRDSFNSFNSLESFNSYKACLFPDLLNTAIHARAKITIKVRAFAGICKLKSTLA